MELTSPTIGKIAEALAKAQGEFPEIVHNRQATIRMKAGGGYVISYADYAQIVKAVTPPLSKNGLAFTQVPYGINGNLVMRTVLMHISGEWIANEIPLKVIEDGMHAVGSALSYSRRYGLSALAGVATEHDDDANLAEGNVAKFSPFPKTVPAVSPSQPASQTPSQFMHPPAGYNPAHGKGEQPAAPPTEGGWKPDTLYVGTNLRAFPANPAQRKPGMVELEVPDLGKIQIGFFGLPDGVTQDMVEGTVGEPVQFSFTDNVSKKTGQTYHNLKTWAVRHAEDTTELEMLRNKIQFEVERALANDLPDGTEVDIYSQWGYWSKNDIPTVEAGMLMLKELTEKYK